MFSVAPMPVFTAGGDARTPVSCHSHQPSVSSPLSSSPIRASSPLSPMKNSSINATSRQTQSSPIQAKTTFDKFSRYATQSTPSAARMRRPRTDARENRRKNFMEQVRRRADERTLQRRDMEGTLMKSSWDRDMRQRALQKQMEGEAFFSAADIDDAAELLLEQEREQNRVPGPSAPAPCPPSTEDEMMADEMARLEESELEAMLTAYGDSCQQEAVPEQPQHTEAPRSHSPTFVEEDEYDALFMELASREAGAHAGAMDMS